VFTQRHPPVAHDHRVRVGAVQRRPAVGDGLADELVAERGGRDVDRGADHARPRRADRRGGVRQVGVAKLEAGAVGWDAEAVGGDLGHRGRHPGAELLGAALDHGAAVAVQARQCPLRLQSRERRDRRAGGGHPGAEQPVPVALGTWCRVASLPAEALRAALVALLQSLARPGVATDGIDVGVVAHPQLDRVQAELVGQLVHRAFQREHPGCFAGGARERRRHGVGPDEPVDAW
jgi:hypothetical protein